MTKHNCFILYFWRNCWNGPPARFSVFKAVRNRCVRLLKKQIHNNQKQLFTNNIIIIIIIGHSFINVWNHSESVSFQIPVMIHLQQLCPGNEPFRDDRSKARLGRTNSGIEIASSPTNDVPVARLRRAEYVVRQHVHRADHRQRGEQSGIGGRVLSRKTAS